MNEPNLSVNIGKIEFPYPVLAASGTFGYGDEFKDLVDLSKLGGMITKTITLAPKEGNPPPRIAETVQGILNAIGLENVGVDNFIDEKLPLLKDAGVKVIASIAGGEISEYIRLARRLSEVETISGLELNISCPNVKRAGGTLFAQDARATYKLVKAVRKATKLSIISKLSPNVSDIASIARAAWEAGSDAVSLVNTFLGMAVDVNTKMPKLGNVTGGLSGPAIKPLALVKVWQVAKKIDIPVIGMGGIMNAEDALEFIIAGASLVAIGTANFINPRAAQEIVAGIKNYMTQNNIEDIKELSGSLCAQID